MKKREIVLITIFFVMLANAVYYLAYFAPIYAETVQLEQLNAERAQAVDTAIQNLQVYKAVADDKASRESGWEALESDIPLDITPESFIRRVDKIISPRARELNLQLAAGENSGSGPARTLAINITFTATYGQIQDILADFAKENIANRVADVTLTADPDLPDTYDVTILAEFLARSEFAATAPTLETPAA